jgi:7-cyano-7-deazaguanine synthase
MSKALVILSGGQDSTTCLFWAIRKFIEVRAVTFDYGQRHSIELSSAKAIAALANVQHEILTLPENILAGTSPLTDKTRDVSMYKNVESLPIGLEDTFVPGRNMLFLTLAANRAYVYDIHDIVIGVAQEDFGGYPDCRTSFINQMAIAISFALNQTTRIRAPLMYMTKSETVKLAMGLPGCMEALKLSHTCYNGQHPPCSKCHACLLREKGFSEAGVKDPLLDD